MTDKQAESKEAVIKEYPKTSYLLDGNRIQAAGNLILTNERLLFLRQVPALSKKEIETVQQIAQDTTKLLQFGLSLHKKNFQLTLADIVAARIGMLSYFPVRVYLRVDYVTGSKKIKSLGFMFSQPLIKRLMMSEFPTLGWKNAINKAVKNKRKAARK